mmetsp:Transcript_38584/g.61840  ORF Transcript_38584/g.61840 Transcript_38584/m.61840 type:complete len:213 (+) Transcript_38584:952-1590(+)
MQAAASVMGIWNDVLDAAEALEKLHEEGRFQEREHEPGVRAHHALVHDRALLALSRVDPAVKAHHLFLLLGRLQPRLLAQRGKVRRGELLIHCLDELGIQKVFKVYVGERFRVSEAFAVLVRQPEQALLREVCGEQRPHGAVVLRPHLEVDVRRRAEEAKHGACGKPDEQRERDPQPIQGASRARAEHRWHTLARRGTRGIRRSDEREECGR